MTVRRALSWPEQILLASDRPALPIIIAMIGRTDGQVNAGWLAAAAAPVFARHRATRSELADRFGSDGWQVRAEPRPPVVTECEVASVEDAWLAMRRDMLAGFDLTRGPLVRLFVLHHPDGDWVGILGHHVAVDGMAVSTLLQQTLAAYPPPAVPADHSPADHSPAGRPLAGRSPAGIVQGPPRAATRLRPGVRTWQTAVARARRRVTPTQRYLAAVGPAGAPGFALSHTVIPAPRPPRLPDGTTPTVNDVLVAAVHRAAGQWNTLRGRPAGTLRLRVAIGAGARTELDGLSSGFVLVSSDARQRASATLLLQSVSAQTTAAKARVKAAAEPAAQPHRPGRGGGLTARVRSAVERALRATPVRARMTALRIAISAARPMLMPAAAVSNLGHVPTDLTVGAGGPRLVDLHFTAPGRMPQGLAVHVLRMAGQVHLTFCHASELFDDAAARRFVELYRTAVTDLAGLADAVAVAPRRIATAADDTTPLLRSGAADVGS